MRSLRAAAAAASRARAPPRRAVAAEASASTPRRPPRRRLDDAALEAAPPGTSKNVVQAWIARGLVFVDGERVTKAGAPVKDGAVVDVRAKEDQFVCR